MSKNHSIFRFSLLLAVLLSVVAASSAWAQVATDASCVAACGQKLPLTPDQGDEPIQLFEDEREQERDGGEEGFIARAMVDMQSAVRRPSRLIACRTLQSFSASVFKVPII